MPRPGHTRPDLSSELSRMQKRLNALERRPILGTHFDTYPCMEWAATPRGRAWQNVWSSCGIANVTGPSFDRLEAKFLADRVIPARSEVELRLAAFKHPTNSFGKVCIGATSTVRITSNSDVIDTTSAVGVGKWRWIHGIPSGWDTEGEEDGDSIYTIELQHRNPDDCPQSSDGSWDGAYKVSNMHYCAGLPEDQLPEATETGWFSYTGGSFEMVRQPNIEEAFMNF